MKTKHFIAGEFRVLQWHGSEKIPESCSLLFNLLILLKSLGELFPSRGKLLTVVAPKESVAIFVFITFEDMLRKFTREHRT